MTIISEQQTSVTPDTGKHATLAMCAYVFGLEAGGHLLRRALVAEILVDWHGMDATDAIGDAIYGCDTRVADAGREADRLIRQAERVALAAEQDGQVPA